jgi:pilus assembly protein Flp/PilA
MKFIRGPRLTFDWKRGGAELYILGWQRRAAGQHLPWQVSRRNRPERVLHPVCVLVVRSFGQADFTAAEVSMKSFALKVQKFLKSEDGPTAVEYAVMLALIVIVCLTAIQSVGTNAKTTFTNVANSIGGGGGS